MKLFIKHTSILAGFFLLQFYSITAKAEKLPEIIVIQNPQISKSDKEAILILPGFGDKRSRRKQQKKFFAASGYDLYIPDYKDRKSIAGTVENLHRFYRKHGLDQYKKVHVFSYILGSWVLNTYILQYGKGNIATIVYDRSPLQERAPRVVADKIPTIAKISKGKVIIELSKMAYPSIPAQDINMGIIVESKATKLIKFFKKTTLGYGPIDWKNLDFNQVHNDLMFTRLNHDELYTRFDVIGGEILGFIKNGVFTVEARRIPYDWDVFEKYKE